MRKGLIFKSVDDNHLKHSIEKRGFVEVPLDYTNINSVTIKVFFRLIPAYGSEVDDLSKPLIVVMNGGPGAASSVYRTLDFDYHNPNNPKNGFDRFKYFLRSYRILLVDQRGTDGLSAPLDFTKPNIDPHAVAKLFSSDSQARDYLAAIECCVGPQEPFFIIGQSYGGMPAMQYLALPQARKTSGIVFSSASLPYEDYKAMLLSRRREQLLMNQQLKMQIPDISTTLNQLREHFIRIGLNPMQVHGYYTWLGKGPSGLWERALSNQLQALFRMDKESIEHESSEQLGEVNLLNYILSSTNVTPGHTDRTLARWTTEQIPFEPWMLDENEIYLQIGQDGSWHGDYVNELDKVTPAPTQFPSISKLRTKIADQQLLFTCAENDVFVPQEAYLDSLHKFLVLGHTDVRELPGGHHAIFLEDGYQMFLDWARNKL